MSLSILELISKLTAVHGPSGDEGAIREVIAELAKPFADEITSDVMGNLVVHKKGSGPKIMFAAHMDSIGLIVTHIDKEGFLRVGKLGDVSLKEALGTPVRFKNGVCGVLAAEEKAESKPKLEECYVDIGAKDEAQARSVVQVGDTAVYHTTMTELNGRVMSPYLDDRSACAILLKTLEQAGDCENDLYFVFTVQEEVGTRGAKTAAWSVEPDYAIAVDVTDVDDTPGAARYGTCKLGCGAGIKVMDHSVICHPEVVDALERCARDKGIAVQRDILRAGGTDAGPIHVSRTGVRTGGISIPCRYVHTPAEIADLNDCAACVELAVAFARRQMTAI